MLNCNEVTFLMSAARERTLTFSERMKLRLHVGMCRSCARFEKQLPMLGAAAKKLAADSGEDPSQDET